MNITDDIMVIKIECRKIMTTTRLGVGVFMFNSAFFFFLHLYIKNNNIQCSAVIAARDGDEIFQSFARIELFDS